MSKKTELQAKLTEAEIDFPADATNAQLEALLAGPKSIVPKVFKDRYKKQGGNCGDELADAMNSTVKGEKGKIDGTKLAAVMAQNGVEKGRWSNLNVGQRRMNLGNVLRARIKRGEAVTVGETEWSASEEAATA